MTSRVTARKAHERLMGHKERLLEIRNTLQGRLKEAATFKDPHMNAEGVNARRAQLKQTARQEFREILKSELDRAKSDTALIREWAATARPQPQDAVAMLRQQRAWDRARVLLESHSGTSLSALLKSTSDAETLLALREEAPSWLRSRSKAEEWNPQMAVALVRSIDSRLAVISTGDQRDALLWEQDVDVALAASSPYAAVLSAEVTGTSHDGMALTAAVESKMASARLAAGYPEPTPDVDPSKLQEVDA